MASRELTLKAHQLAAVSSAFSSIKGPKPIQLSLAVSKILQACDEAHRVLIDDLKPYIDDAGSINDDSGEAEKILSQDVALDVPDLHINELVDADVTVDDDTALALLIQLNVITE